MDNTENTEYTEYTVNAELFYKNVDRVREFLIEREKTRTGNIRYVGRGRTMTAVMQFLTDEGQVEETPIDTANESFNTNRIRLTIDGADADDYINAILDELEEEKKGTTNG